MKKILFIHHGSHAGGAPLSMLYTMQGMKQEGYYPIAALLKPSIELHKLYNDAGFETIETHWIPIFITWSGSDGKRYNPIMWKGVWNAWKKWRLAHQKLALVLKEQKIDIVHLNSVALSNPASLLMEMNFPFVWHIREYGPRHKGYRYKFLQKRLLKAKHVIFLSKGEQKSWLQGVEHGTIVHNFVNFNKFKNDIDLQSIKRKYKISEDEKIILFVGGVKKHKGLIVLLKAIQNLKKEKPNLKIKCLMPDSKFDLSNPDGSYQKLISKYILGNNLTKQCLLLPFNSNIVDQFAICDLLVFPAIKPHFARPIVEASAMRKPVIASRLSPMDELIKEGETGYTFTPFDSNDLAEKIGILCSNDDLRNEMGEKGHSFVQQEFEFESQMKKIVKVYDNMNI